MKNFMISVALDFDSTADEMDYNIQSNLVDQVEKMVTQVLSTKYNIEVHDSDKYSGKNIELYCNSEDDVDGEVLEQQLDKDFMGKDVIEKSDAMVQRNYSPLDLSPDYVEVTDIATIEGFTVEETLEENVIFENNDVEFIPDDGEDNPFIEDKGAGVEIFNNLNTMNEEKEILVEADLKAFEFVYKIDGRGDAIHSTYIRALDQKEATTLFFNKMDDAEKTPIILEVKLARG